jgi:hypothetical protein
MRTSSFFYCGILVLPVLFFDFLGAAIDEISDCRAVDGGAVGCLHCRAGGGQFLIAHEA